MQYIYIFAKLILNAVSVGKFGQRIQLSETKMGSSKAEFFQIRENPKLTKRASCESRRSRRDHIPKTEKAGDHV